ncbi:MAG: methylmalonyl-CoA mutase, partial [Bradyrhizobium sp.]|nr:methylmalonyl-CoA mutase [Bradyrhizobium sp.]
PRVFLANLGKPSEFTARAAFAKSFFESGGIEALDNEGFSNASTLASAYQASGADLVCLCSVDKVYAEQAADAALTLKAAGARHIYLAGTASGPQAALRTAGVNTFIFAGGDALAVLQEAYRQMEQP